MKLENLNTMEGQLKFADDIQKFLIEEMPSAENGIKQKISDVKRKIINKNTENSLIDKMSESDKLVC